jgi:hypothetical protein
MFEVMVGAKLEGVPTNAWAPTDTDKFACTKKEALRRYHTLLMAGRAGDVVDGFIPWCVEIVDTRKGHIVLGSTTEENDKPYGPWANDAPSS